MGCVTIICVALVFWGFHRWDMPWWGYFIVTLMAIGTFTKGLTEAEVTQKPDLEAIKASVREELEGTLRTEKGLATGSAGSLRAYRNNLMKHHEGKTADPAYQASSTCKETTEILQELNRLIDQKKARA